MRTPDRTISALSLHAEAVTSPRFLFARDRADMTDTSSGDGQQRVDSTTVSTAYTNLLI